jgi:SAM-dependent methyltransferase
MAVMQARTETWESFWAQAWRIDFFAAQRDAYRQAADARAAWLEETFQPDKSKPVLSLACGEGGIEIALARRGFNVTGIDLCPTFVYHAREQAAQEGLEVTFLVADLRQDAPLPGGNGLVYCFDTFGMLAGEAEQVLVAKMAAALAKDGILLVDSPQREAQRPGRAWWPVRDGFLLQETRWDAGANSLHVEPLFIEADGARVSLLDPYDKTRGEHSGVERYVYSPAELTMVLKTTGLGAEAVRHQRPGYFMAVAGAQIGQTEEQ